MGLLSVAYKDDLNMGPSMLIDKSAIQGFSMDEIKVLHRHYDVVICPTLIHEFQGDLAKTADQPELDKDRVAYLAEKAMGFGARTIDRYEKLAYANLIGFNFPLGPQIPRFDARQVKGKDGSNGVLLKETPEEVTLRRWSQRQFAEDERTSGESYRRKLAEVDLEKLRAALRLNDSDDWKANSLDEIAAAIDRVDGPFDIDGWNSIEMTMSRFGFSGQTQDQVKQRYGNSGRPRFKDFAPYAHYCNRLSLIFLLGLKCGLVPTSKRAKAVIDYQYLFFAPFCNVFCSGDKFHAALATTVLRADQRYIDATILKSDLGILADCHAKMNEVERHWYMVNFGDRPPPIQNSITNDVWKQFARPWEMGSGNRVLDMTEDEKAKILKELRESEPIDEGWEK
jgi:hypothetical protein